jgi:hypothetical protein
MAGTYARDPNALDALKKFVLPGSEDAVSSGVLENDPELGLPIATTNAEQDSNDKLKRMIGLGPSPMVQRQGRDLAAQDTAISQARTAAQPDVLAESDRLQKQKLALAGEPNRVAGENSLAVEKQKQAPLLDFMNKQQSSGGVTGAPMEFTPSISENGISFHGQPEAKLNAQEQSMVDSAQGITALGQPLLQKFAAKYPGIDANPEKYGSLLADTLAPKIGKAAYMFGGMTDNDALMQDSAAIQAWGMKALMNGRINRQMMDLISAHLPQPGFSPGANYDRLRRLMTEIIPSQLQGISAGRGANPMQLPQAPADPYSDPNWGQK